MWLVVDTALPEATVVLARIETGSGDETQVHVVAAHTLRETRRHAEHLPGAVDTVLRDAGIDVDALTGVAVGTGPGSFIGIRTGMSFAKGLAAALDVPLVGLPSLLALAASDDDRPADRRFGADAIVAVVDAKRGERYLLTIRPDEPPAARVREGLEGCVALAPAAVQALLDDAPPALLIGALADLTPPAETRAVPREGASARGLASALRCRLLAARPSRDDTANDARNDAANDVETAAFPADEREGLVPVYLRDADAKLPAADPAWRRAQALELISTTTTATTTRPTSEETP